MSREGKWQHKKTGKILEGRWEYIWHRDVFMIYLNSTDPITGRLRTITSSLDSPEWGKWKLIKE